MDHLKMTELSGMENQETTCSPFISLDFPFAKLLLTKGSHEKKSDGILSLRETAKNILDWIRSPKQGATTELKVEDKVLKLSDCENAKSMTVEDALDSKDSSWMDFLDSAYLLNQHIKNPNAKDPFDVNGVVLYSNLFLLLIGTHMANVGEIIQQINSF